MSQNPLSVNESGSKSYLLGKSNQSTDSAKESESGGFLNALKSVFSSESEPTESSKKIKVDGSEESSKTKGELGTENVEGKGSESSKVAAVAAVSTDEAGGEESVDKLLSSSEESSDVAGDVKNAKKQNVDQTMTEGNDLLGRLDDSNKALKTKDTPTDANSAENIDSNGNKLPQNSAVVAGAAGQPLNEKAISEQDIADAKSKYLQQSNVDASNGIGAATVDKASAETSKLSSSQVTDETSSDFVKGAVAVSGGMASGGMIVANQGQIAQTSAGAMSNLSVDGAQSGAESLHKTGQAGMVQGTSELSGEDAQLAGAATANSAVSQNGLKHANQSPQDAQIDWTQNTATQSAMDSDTKLATTFSDTQKVDLKGAQASAVGAGVIANQVASETSFDGQPLAASEQLQGQYTEPMWTTTSSEMSKAELQAAKGAIESTNNAKMAASAALAAHLANPTSTPLPADRMAAASATQIMPQEINAAAMNQQMIAQSMTAGAATQTSNVAAASVAGSAAVLGATKLAKGNENGHGEKADFSQQLAGVASQQGLTAAQAKAEGQAVATTQQSPLQLSRDGAAAGDQLAERVQMMLSKNLKNVDIRLDPPELGRMQIRMTMNNDIASVQFTVANQQTRDIVEQAMPRLREMLSQQGLQLADTSVQQQNAGQQQQSQYVAGQGSGKGKDGDGIDSEFGSEGDESLEVNVDVKPNRDGISFYA
ncbi:flagellar hook-length control protein FliK [Vibrio penaeicida]|uniref:Flagellar hook-length control protein FliK n=1 Tax=Vibrio penaeicida TaxID=104609 RepID=A0AAV5NXA4_9VIBR|nr:flagellar hook-length control protein FliK [Vibrio penaeicida]RTZ21519.1 flagellar hook-length control protein FliK [Vibrio penaeicida]GLQ75217.1 flagellar hook-length control protein FliK [Vibrio penaeicida]